MIESSVCILYAEEEEVARLNENVIQRIEINFYIRIEGNARKKASRNVVENKNSTW